MYIYNREGIIPLYLIIKMNTIKIKGRIINMINSLNQKCEDCNSHLITYKENESIKIECSNCGLIPSDLNFSFRTESNK